MSGFTEEEKVSLLTLARGAGLERFDDELQRVMDNIVDPNTATGARSITLKVTIKPDANGATGSVKIECNSKLQSAQPCSTLIYIGKQGSRGIAFEHDPEQLNVPFPAPAALEGGKVVAQ